MFSIFVREKVTITENISFTDYASGIELSDCSKLTLNWKISSHVIIFRKDIIVKFFGVVSFLLSSTVTDPNLLSVSLLVMEL